MQNERGLPYFQNWEATGLRHFSDGPASLKSKCSVAGRGRLLFDYRTGMLVKNGSLEAIVCQKVFVADHHNDVAGIPAQHSTLFRGSLHHRKAANTITSHH